jgi:hypothetical protein
MAPIRHSKSIHTSSAYFSELSRIAALHGGSPSHRLGRHQPYEARLSTRTSTSLDNSSLPSVLLEKIKVTQEAAVNKDTQRKDASRLR